MTPPDFVWGAIGAAIGWPVVEFVARPFRQFFDIRRQVARCLVEYANVRAPSREDQRGDVYTSVLPPEDNARLAEAQTAYRRLAGDMRAFAADWAFKLNNTADIVAKVMKACEQPVPAR